MKIHLIFLRIFTHLLLLISNNNLNSIDNKNFYQQLNLFKKRLNLAKE